MIVIGFRCSTDVIVYSVLTGTKIKPQVKRTNELKIPKCYKRIEELKWIYQEISEIIKKEMPDLICLKDTEAMARKGNNYTKRLENETAIIIAASFANVKNFYKKVKATIAKDLGLKGRSKYLKTQLDCSVICNYDNYNDHEKESILSAWSLLL